MSNLIQDFKCKNTTCYFYHKGKINKCFFYIGLDAGSKVEKCKNRLVNNSNK